MKRIILTLVLSMLSVGVNAASVFQYQSACASNCSLYGLSDLDSISGTITFDDSAVIANGYVDEINILSFSFTFGAFSTDSSSSASFYFDGTLDGTADSFSAFSFVTSEVLNSGSGDAFFVLNNDSSFSDQGRIGSGRCNGSCSPATFFTFSQAHLSAVSSLTAVPVPIPAAVWLFGSGLGLLGWFRKKV
jgi:hypothetical protein